MHSGSEIAIYLNRKRFLLFQCNALLGELKQNQHEMQYATITDLFSSWQFVQEIDSEVEEVEGPPGGDEDGADPDEEVVRLPPPLLLAPHSVAQLGSQ